tara:strand:- start:1437 stop:1646 length:210 start_codon:yes stop_codon:yes gene_type:complete
MPISRLSGYAKEMEIRVDQNYEELARLSNKPEAFWREHLEKRFDWFIRPAEAIELGLVDGIIKRSSASP